MAAVQQHASDNSFWEYIFKFTDYIRDIAVAVISVVGLRVWDYYSNKKRTTHLKRFANNLTDMSEMFTAMAETISGSDVIDRIVIFEGHDTDAVPQPGKPYFTKSLHADHRDKAKAVELQARTQDVKVDGEYISVILSVMSTGKATIDTHKLPPSLLKRIYEEDNVKYSEIYYLSNTASRVYYISISSEQESHHRFEHNKDRLLIDQAVTNIQQLFLKYYS